MPRKDFYHETVKQALEKDGWRITDDPFKIEFEGLRLFADIGAERSLAAEREGEKIVVEIKVFGGVSSVDEFEKALGQYSFYRTLMKKLNLPHQLFLAISESIFKEFFQRPAIRVTIEDHKIQLLIFAPESEEIVEWKKWKSTEK